MQALLKPGLATRVRIARLRRGERGVAMVEFALVLPLLLVLVFGIIDFGRTFQSWITLTNAAREGARLGAVGATASDIVNRCQTTAGVSGVSCTVTGVPGQPGADVSVTASATITFVTPIGSLISLMGGKGLKSTFPLTSTSVMRLE